MQVPVLSRRHFLLAGCPFFDLFHKRTVRAAGIEFRIYRRGRSSRRYVVLHGDETTAKATVASYPFRGTGYSVASDTRTVEVAGGRIDPNRLFSRAGAEQSYKRYNPGWLQTQLEAALDLLDRQRPRLLKTLLPPAGGILIALHNNARGYSLEDEIRISQSVHLPRRGEPHEFFLVTSHKDFARLSAGPYNVLLQSDPAGPDDGSLSRYCAARQIRYVNLEVANGKTAIQREMLAWLDRNL